MACLAGELTRLFALHRAGALDAEQFTTAKAAALSDIKSLTPQTYVYGEQRTQKGGNPSARPRDQAAPTGAAPADVHTEPFPDSTTQGAPLAGAGFPRDKSSKANQAAAAHAAQPGGDVARLTAYVAKLKAEGDFTGALRARKELQVLRAAGRRHPDGVRDSHLTRWSRWLRDQPSDTLVDVQEWADKFYCDVSHPRALELAQQDWKKVPRQYFDCFDPGAPRAKLSNPKLSVMSIRHLWREAEQNYEKRKQKSERRDRRRMQRQAALSQLQKLAERVIENRDELFGEADIQAAEQQLEWCRSACGWAPVPVIEKQKDQLLSKMGMAAVVALMYGD